MKLVWTDDVFLSLKDIQDYIARDSKYYAYLQVEKILAYEAHICKYPYSGRVVPEYSDESIREIIEGHYRIIYHIVNDSLIEVLTVVHTASFFQFTGFGIF
ncbi:MAG: type II toxin-antitoxin system RelE/ParE family toxin [Spirochaetaceae bacterium]|jgi:toxin ParE1/3/4|nr:type II toxin-antitoxin system RelE/ParE family toxin [Spirochaetaceae bacterium]